MDQRAAGAPLSYPFPPAGPMQFPNLGGALPPMLFRNLRIGVKLADSSEFDDCNTERTLSTLVKEPRDAASIKTVAEFGREILSQCAPDWVLRIIRRHASMRKRSKTSFVISFGGGCDLLVLLEGAEIPKDLTKVHRTSIALSVTTKTEEAQQGLANLGVTNHNDSIWEHVDAVASVAPNPNEVLVILSESVVPYGVYRGFEDRVEVINIWTPVKHLFDIARLDPPYKYSEARAGGGDTMAGGEEESSTKAAAQPETGPSDAAKSAPKQKPARKTGAAAKKAAQKETQSEPVVDPVVAAVTTPQQKTGGSEGSAKKPTEPAVRPAVSGGDTPATQPKKRGRPKGSKNKPKDPNAEPAKKKKASSKSKSKSATENGEQEKTKTTQPGAGEEAEKKKRRKKSDAKTDDA